MTRTMAKLRGFIEGPKQSPHIYTSEWSAKYEIPDHVSDGFVLLTEDADLCAIAPGDEETRGGGATSKDLGVN